MKAIHLIGYGSQGKAWAESLRAAGWDVHVYLANPKGPSFKLAEEQGFHPIPLSELPKNLQSRSLVAFLCPDLLIGSIYRDYLTKAPVPLTLVLAHGYAVYAGELKPAHPEHELALLAPKAIGPKLQNAMREMRAMNHDHHSLVAAFHAPEDRKTELLALAKGLGFAEKNLAPASFEQEAMGDLISEQGVLCGGVFTLMEWTFDAMAEAGVPDALIREECITELELIIGLMREKGPATTFKAISQAAQCGAVSMRKKLNDAGVKKTFRGQLDEVVNKKFVQTLRGEEWKKDAADLMRNLDRWEGRFK